MIGAISLQIVLIFLNAIFASAEIAVISINETRLKKLVLEGNVQAIRVATLTEQPARFLATIQVAITMAGLLGSAFAAESFAGPLVDTILRSGVRIPENILKSIAVLIITLILAYFNLVFGELVPKRLAMQKAEKMALGMSGMLCFVGKMFTPLVALLTISTNTILRLMRINLQEKEGKVSEEEIKMLLVEGNQQGTIDTQEKEMIQNIFAFDAICVEQICTHRRDVVALELDASLEEWDNLIYDTRHSYYPVFRETLDNIIGVLDTKDYFRYRMQTKAYIIEKSIQKALFIPESKKANILFQSMKQNRNYFAVIIDEYGGAVGIITLHDLMESLVGDIHDAKEKKQQPEIEKINENEWVILGHAALDAVANKLNIILPTEQFDTYNGFICGTIGRIPHDGEIFECKYEKLRIKVHRVKNHRVIETTVQVLEIA